MPAQSPVWTPETVSLFWDFWWERGDRSPWNFSQFYVEGLINFLTWRGVLEGEVLDYGCGAGHLARRMLQCGARVTAVDFSAHAVAAAQQRGEGFPNWRGATLLTELPSPLPAAQYDLVCCIEVVEHLLDDWLESTFAELDRLTRPGGRIFVTTPCEEDLGALVSYCPFSNTTFHSVQHVRSWNATTLADRFVSQGYTVEFCRGVELGSFQDDLRLPPLLDWSVRIVRRVALFRLLRHLDRWFPRPERTGRAFARATRHPGPHLCGLFRKPSEPTA